MSYGSDLAYIDYGWVVMDATGSAGYSHDDTVECGPDAWVECGDLWLSSSGASAACGYRVEDNNTLWRWIRNTANSNHTLTSRHGSGNVAKFTHDDQGENGDSIRAEAAGTTHTVFINGEEIHSGTYSEGQAGGALGFVFWKQYSFNDAEIGYCKGGPL